MDLELTGKAAVVTGASKGIGLAVAATLAAEGVRVVAAARTRTPELDGLVETYGQDAVIAVQEDLAGPDGPARVVQRAVEAFGGLDVLVNNVGATIPRAGFLDVGDAAWQAMFEVNFFSAVRASRAALPSLLARGGGVIVNVSSVNGRQPFPMVVDYAAAKAALTNLTKTLSEEFAPQGVRVNAVSPGPVRTPMWTDGGGVADAVAAGAGVTRDEAISTVVPQMMQLSLGRFAEAQEVADLVAYLASDRAAAITGSEMTIDSGLVKST